MRIWFIFIDFGRELIILTVKETRIIDVLSKSYKFDPHLRNRKKKAFENGGLKNNAKGSIEQKGSKNTESS